MSNKKYQVKVTREGKYIRTRLFTDYELAKLYAHYVSFFERANTKLISDGKTLKTWGDVKCSKNSSK